MIRHKVTRKTKTGKVVTYWRGDGAKSSKPGAGKEFAKRKTKLDPFPDRTSWNAHNSILEQEQDNNYHNFQADKWNLKTKPKELAKAKKEFEKNYESISKKLRHHKNLLMDRNYYT